MAKPTQTAARVARSVSRAPGLLLLLLGALALGGGCGLFGGQTGQESDSQRVSGPPTQCSRAATRVLDDQTRTPLGFSARDVLEAEGGPQSAPLSWYARGEATQLHVELSLDGGEVRAVHAEQPGVPASCDELQLDVTVSLVTDDGLLDERVATTLHAQSAHDAHASFTLALSALHGSYDAAELDLGGVTNPALRIDLQLNQGATSGSIFLEHEDPDPTDNETPTSPAVAGWP